MTAARRRDVTLYPERRSTLWRAALILVASTAACSDGDSTGPDLAVEVTDPAQAVFVTSDIPHFWAAYDAGGSAGASAPFQTEYLNRASPGLADFIGLRDLTAASLASMVRSFPRYFADIRPQTLRLANEAALQNRMRDGYRRIKDVYPPAVFPPVTFLIGRFSTGGTTSNNGMLIGLEFFSLGPNTPTDELRQFQRDNVRPLDSLPMIVAHEHVHILQIRARGLMSHPSKNLLEQSLLEGSADFIGELASGGYINAWLRAYAIPREAELWAEFRTAMHGTDVTRWLYNQGSATSERPGDLGYFIGYRIAEAYYDRASDKRAAVQAIIEIKDADQFLTASGYAPPGDLLRQIAPPNRQSRRWSRQG